MSEEDKQRLKEYQKNIKIKNCYLLFFVKYKNGKKSLDFRQTVY